MKLKLDLWDHVLHIMVQCFNEITDLEQQQMGKMWAGFELVWLSVHVSTFNSLLFILSFWKWKKVSRLCLLKPMLTDFTSLLGEVSCCAAFKACGAEHAVINLKR